jgi:hypothetical protein
VAALRKIAAEKPRYGYRHSYTTTYPHPLRISHGLWQELAL